MKLTRVVLACTFLLLVALPSFAVPCHVCEEYSPVCVLTPGSGTVCRYTIDGCYDIFSPSCSPFTDIETQPAMLAEWTVASIEVRRPSERMNVVPSPAAVVEAAASQTALQN
jgi:hypothetical protein